ncbi:MAG: nitroreductase family protein [Alicyclobacillus herbarius]|uniref:nitroreductase family protein n=1 Tax=Alicyclobacillus herbarius TaxID=122960 RepID=UPI00040A499B|nr:nitroreductase family protein [Alicyclobacillus herbarius]MCL6633618.1 nitroreductase family protein [Alicyclobacillus herbarius]
MQKVVDGLTEEVAQHRKPSYEVPAVFLNRWSPRAFAERPVADELLYQVLEAARWAPSSYNEQPWRFIIARTEENRRLFCEFINPRNVVWCQNAPVLALLVSYTRIKDGLPNRKHAFDAGAAWASLALAATELGLTTHAMGAFDTDKARTVLGIPEEYEPQIVIAIGYRGDAKNLPEEFREREKPSDRRPLAETVFEGRFGVAVAGLK